MCITIQIKDCIFKDECIINLIYINYEQDLYKPLVLILNIVDVLSWL